MFLFLHTIPVLYYRLFQIYVKSVSEPPIHVPINRGSSHPMRAKMRRGAIVFDAEFRIRKYVIHSHLCISRRRFVGARVCALPRVSVEQTHSFQYRCEHDNSIHAARNAREHGANIYYTQLAEHIRILRPTHSSPPSVVCGSVRASYRDVHVRS